MHVDSKRRNLSLEGPTSTRGLNCPHLDTWVNGHHPGMWFKLPKHMNQHTRYYHIRTSLSQSTPGRTRQTITMQAALLQELNNARSRKALSGLLNKWAGSRKTGWGKFFGGAGDIAGALGFKRALKGGQPRKRSGKKKNSTPRKTRIQGPLNRGKTSIESDVGAGDAPVAFARTKDLRPFFRAYPSREKDGLIVHSVDYVAQTGTWSTTAGAWQSQLSQFVMPGNTTLHPWLSGIAPLFQRYKLKKLVLHYQHFVSTAVAGEIVLQFSADPEINNNQMGNLTQTQSQNMSNYMVGSCYEDFSHNCDLTGVDRARWFDTETTLISGGDPNDNYAGAVAVFSANGVASQPSTGNIFIESVYEFQDRKMSTVTVGLSKARKVLLAPKISAEEKKSFLHAYVDSAVDQVTQELARRRAPVDSATSIILEQRATQRARSVPSTSRPTGLDPCRICGQADPDHLGRDCPRRPA